MRGNSFLYLQTRQDLCLVRGTAAGKYASQLLKASCASYAKGLAPHALRRLVHKNSPFHGWERVLVSVVHVFGGFHGRKCKATGNVKQPEMQNNRIFRKSKGYSTKK